MPCCPNLITPFYEKSAKKRNIYQQGKGAVPVSTPATTKPTPAAQPQAANEAKTEASIPPVPTKTDEKATRITLDTNGLDSRS